LQLGTCWVPTAQDGIAAMGYVECALLSAATVYFTAAGELPSSGITTSRPVSLGSLKAITLSESLHAGYGSGY